MNGVPSARLSRGTRATRGSVAVLFAVLLPVIIGLIGIAVDISIAYGEKNALQSSAESAALATAQYIGASDRSGALPTARSYAAMNRPNVADLVAASELEFGSWADGTFTPGGAVNAVRVTASRTEAKNNAITTYFARSFGFPAWNLSASAIAAVNPLCILLLHPTHGDAFDVDPGARIDAPQCTVQVNSSNHGALELGSSSYVNVRSLRVTGGVDKSSSAIVSPTPMTGARPAADPYLLRSPPVNNLCGGPSRVNSGTTTLSPTFAFCRGLVIDGAKLTLQPGVYVIKGEFTMRSGSSISGTDVLIYMEGQGSDLFFYSKTSFDLKAPRTGPYAGIVLWSDRANTRDHDIYSKFGASAEGTIYMPSSQLEFENNVEWEADCIRIIAARMELDNNSKYKSGDPISRCANNIGGSAARLVR